MSKKETDKRFEKFGTVAFTSQSKVNDFIDYLEQGKVSGTRCKKCGLDFFPPRADCPKCLESDIEWFEIKDTGKLVTFTRMSYGPKGFEEDVPYTIAVVDFNAFRVFGRISNDIPEESVKIGMELAVKSNNLPNGQLNYLFCLP